MENLSHCPWQETSPIALCPRKIKVEIWNISLSLSNIPIFMNNSQDQMRCLWTTQEDICIYTEDYFSPLDILPLKKYHNGRRTNPNKYIIIVRRSFSTGVAVYLLQQTKYLVIWQRSGAKYQIASLSTSHTSNT